MNIQNVKDLGNNYLVNNSFSIPKDHLNSDYKKVEKWLETNELSPRYTLEELIELKLSELDNYHFNSPEIRILTINNSIKFFLSEENRKLFQEQINFLEKKIQYGEVTAEEAFFRYNMHHDGLNNDIELDYIDIPFLSLVQALIKVMDIINPNYLTYKLHQKNIKALTTIEEVEAYDVTANYIKNQNINIS